MRRCLVRLLYKSGNSIDIDCNSVEIEKRGGTLTRITFDDPKPRALLYGLDDIEGVYMLREG